MDQLLSLTISLALLVFAAGVLVQMTSVMFGRKPDWFASLRWLARGIRSLLRWLARGIRRGAYRLLMVVSDLFHDAAREINHAVQNQSVWTRLIFGVVALLPWSVGIVFWIPAQILKPPGQKK